MKDFHFQKGSTIADAAAVKCITIAAVDINDILKFYQVKEKIKQNPKPNKLSLELNRSKSLETPIFKWFVYLASEKFSLSYSMTKTHNSKSLGHFMRKRRRK